MSVPSIKTIKTRLRWLNKTHLGADLAAKVLREAMQFADTGKEGKTFAAYADTLPKRVLYESRLQYALRVMDSAAETYGVEYICSTHDTQYEERGLEYLNTGDTYTCTIIYNHDSDSWSALPWGNFVESRPSFYE